MYAGAYLEPSQTFMGELLCKNHKKALLQILGSKYASGIALTVEKVCIMSIFIWYDQSRLQKSVIALFSLNLIKKMLVYLFYDGCLYHKETSRLICSAN